MNTTQEKIEILRNENIRGSYFKLSFEAGRFAKIARPGQFMLIKVNDGPKPLLRKPLGFHKVDGNKIEVLYEVVGEGTDILSRRKPGEHLDIIGPLGNGFSYRSQVTPRLCSGQASHKSQVLVAGGIGVAPLVFLAQKLMEVTNHPSTLLGTGKSQVTSTVLIGAKTKSALLCEKEFKDLGYDVKIATEDGSRGHKGFITEVLNKILVTCDYGLTTIYACGPKPMLKAAAAIAARHKIPCQVLLEEYMACGLGACLGCAVKVKTHDARRTTHDEYKMVCKDGPVFKAGEIIWE